MTTEDAAQAAPELRPEVLAYYERGEEDGRLDRGANRLEELRTRDLLLRLLPPAPARVLDVGGGSGRYAGWLAGLGYRVELLDPVPLHVEQARRRPGVTARVGDARALDVPDASVDAVLLLGPLYHLTERPDRVRALAEARRVVRPGGPVVAATINRFAGLHDTLYKENYFDPARRPHVDAVTVDGHLRPSAEQPGFTTAYFHQPGEVPGEFEAAGLAATGQYGVEGAAWLMGGLDAWLADEGRRATVLHAMRLTETDPALLGVSGHLLTAGRRPEPLG
ncbi:class I SAM-dependent methyltransferase [Kitasatospora sp. NPDC096147]|uniref:class I SAM-dependent methyltransferase n=1 Tax=Kitasatospora sp. NPDC096147 TaxID=3364093 RepID=UPI00380BC488